MTLLDTNVLHLLSYEGLLEARADPKNREDIPYIDALLQRRRLEAKKNMEYYSMNYNSMVDKYDSLLKNHTTLSQSVEEKSSSIIANGTQTPAVPITTVEEPESLQTSSKDLVEDEIEQGSIIKNPTEMETVYKQWSFKGTYHGISGQTIVLIQSMLFKYSNVHITPNWCNKKSFTMSELLMVLLVEPEMLKESIYKDALELYPILKSNFQEFLTKNRDMLVSLTKHLILLEQLLIDNNTKFDVSKMFDTLTNVKAFFGKKPQNDNRNNPTKKTQQVFINYDSLLFNEYKKTLDKKVEETKKSSTKVITYNHIYDQQVGKVFHVISMKLQTICLMVQNSLIAGLSDKTSIDRSLARDFDLYKKGFNRILSKLKKEVDLKRAINLKKKQEKASKNV